MCLSTTRLEFWLIFLDSMQQSFLWWSCQLCGWNQKLCPNWLQPIDKHFRNDGIMCFQDYKYKKLKIISVMSVWSNCKLLIETVFSIWKVGLSPAQPPFANGDKPTSQNWKLGRFQSSCQTWTDVLSPFCSERVLAFSPFLRRWCGSKVVVILKNTGYTCLFSWSTKIRHSGSFQ